MSTFTPSRHFLRDYNRLFKKDPASANVFLLLCELADEKGKVRLGPCPEAKIQQLMAARFDNPRTYQFPGGPKR
jgi:hypothetical protein